MSESTGIDMNTFLREFEQAAKKASTTEGDGFETPTRPSRVPREKHSPVDRLLAWSKRRDEKLENMRREEEERRREEEERILASHFRNDRSPRSSNEPSIIERSQQWDINRRLRLLELRREKNAQILDECTFSPAISETARYSKGRLPPNIKEALQRPPDYFTPSETLVRSRRSQNMAARKDQDIREYVARCEMIRDKIAAKKRQIPVPGSRYTGQSTTPKAPKLATARRAQMRQLEKTRSQDTSPASSQTSSRRLSSASSALTSEQKSLDRHELTGLQKPDSGAIPVVTSARNGSTSVVSDQAYSYLPAYPTGNTTGTHTLQRTGAHNLTTHKEYTQPTLPVVPPTMSENHTSRVYNTQVPETYEQSTTVLSDVTGATQPMPHIEDPSAQYSHQISTSLNTGNVALDIDNIDILARIREETERNLMILARTNAAKESESPATVTKGPLAPPPPQPTNPVHLSTQRTISPTNTRELSVSPHASGNMERVYTTHVPQVQQNTHVTFHHPQIPTVPGQQPDQSIPTANVYSYAIDSGSEVHNKPPSNAVQPINDHGPSHAKPQYVNDTPSDDPSLSEELLSRIMSSILSSTDNMDEQVDNEQHPQQQPIEDSSTDNVESLSRLVGLVAETILSNVRDV